MTDLPEPRSLGDGIHLIPIPLPFPSPPWVNSYAIEGSDGLTLIDCGTDWDDGHRALHDGLDSVGLAGADITTLIVSHLHPDHVGMASRLVREHGCRFIMHRRAAVLVDRYNDTPRVIEHYRWLARSHGVPAGTVEEVANVGPRPAFMPIIDPPDVVVDDGDDIFLFPDRVLNVLYTPGHDPSHICLRDSRTRITFSGDHVLPRITPVIMYNGDDPDTLGDYLHSLAYLLDEEIGLTYPAHGTIIDRGDSRVRQIIAHHDRRLEEMKGRVANGSTAWELVGSLFRPTLTSGQQRLALSETVSHLEHLRLQGRATTEERDGVIWYRS